MKSLTIAVGQATAVPFDVAANVSTAVALLHDAAAAGARLLLMPELFLTGYELTAPDIARRDPALLPLVRACKETGSCLVIGAPTPKSGRRRISSLVFGPRHDRASRYDKEHLDDEEAAAGFTPAESNGNLGGIGIGDWLVKPAICFDASFPDHAADGMRAQVYAVSALFMAPERVEEIGRTRAVENGMYVAISNHLGPAGRYVGCGRSGIWSPDGTRIADAGEESPSFAMAELAWAEGVDRSATGEGEVGDTARG